MTPVNERYAKHVRIPGWDQRVLGDATVIIAGVGGLGSEVAKLLAQAGVGRLILCDPDAVEESNLTRGALFTVSDVHDGPTRKVVAAQRALAAIAPDTTVEIRADRVQYAVGLGELRSCALVVSCLDSVADRITLCGRTFLAGSPHGLLDGGTHPWGGEVRHFTQQGPCYVCGCSALDRSLPTWHEACGLPRDAGASAPVTALVASWQAMYAVRLLFGKPMPEPIVRIDALSGQSRPVEQEQDSGCPCHGVIDVLRNIKHTELTNQATVAELLQHERAGEQIQSWNPIDRDDALSSLVLRTAQPERRLHELGIPPSEILPAVSPGQGVRYLELEG